MKFKASNPDAISMTLEITMSLKDWKALRQQLEVNEHPSWALAGQIRDLVTHAEKHFYSEEKP